MNRGPGTACAAIEAVRRAEIVVLVTEPTPYGRSDLEQAVEVVRDALGLPVRVVINRDGERENIIVTWDLGYEEEEEVAE